MFYYNKLYYSNIINMYNKALQCDYSNEINIK